jgi:hypothetical protein
MREVRDGISVTELGEQLFRQRRKNLLAVAGPFFLENLRPDAAPDLPVEEDQGRMDGRGDSLAGALNQGAKVVEELAGDSGTDGCFAWDQLLS